jgi:hypothetical protein
MAALSFTQMKKLLVNAGINIEKVETSNVVVDFLKWVHMTGTPLETVDVLQEQLLKDIGDGSKTGMRPFMQNGSLKFMQIWSVFVGRKSRDRRHV